MVLTIDRVDSLTGTDADAFTRILEASFPADERSPTAEVLHAIAQGDRWTWVARTDGALVGFAVVVPLAATATVLLEYLAVDATRRSVGVGATLLDEVFTALRGDAPERTTMLIEIEEPAALTGAERHQAERRVAFYAARGATPIEVAGSYRPPAFGAADGRSLAMLLLERPLVAAAPSLGAAALGSCVRAILRQSYGLAPDDPQVAAVVEHLLPGSQGTLAS